jgi:hypothetical protein
MAAIRVKPRATSKTGDEKIRTPARKRGITETSLA